MEVSLSKEVCSSFILYRGESFFWSIRLSADLIARTTSRDNGRTFQREPFPMYAFS
jgi:hypothetical protein